MKKNHENYIREKLLADSCQKNLENGHSSSLNKSKMSEKNNNVNYSNETLQPVILVSRSTQTV